MCQRLRYLPNCGIDDCVRALGLFKLWLLIVAILGLAASIVRLEAGLEPAKGSNDRLRPVDIEESKSYRQALTRLLCVTPADVGRMIIRPSNGSELSVAVYSQRSRSTSPVVYRVTVTETSENLWYALEEDHADRIHVQRCDAELPTEVANAVGEAWARALEAAKEPRSNEAGPSTDGEIVEFSRTDSSQRTAIAELPEHPASNLVMLQKAGELLAKFCSASADSRARSPRRSRRQQERSDDDSPRLVVNVSSAPPTIENKTSAPLITRRAVLLEADDYRLTQPSSWQVRSSRFDRCCRQWRKAASRT